MTSLYTAASAIQAHKPEDIPQDVWDRASSFAFGETGDMEADINILVSRAILAAKDEEREACALLIEQGFEREGIRTKNDQCPHGRYGWEDCEQCAVRAIRKRGEG